MSGSAWLPAAVAVAATLLVLAWQAVTVQANYGGNRSALFCTGALRGVPPALASERIYQFPGSTGYDGQFYHYIAHDPLLRDERMVSYADEPRLRYRRILVPALAFTLALGRTDRLDTAFVFVILLFTGLGVFWTACWCRTRGRSAVWGVLFLALPAVIVSVDRMVADVALAALAAGLALYWRTSPWRSFAVLTCAALTRETGLLLVAGYCGWLLLERRITRAALFSMAAAPALGWYGYLQLHTPAYDYHASFVPLSGIWNAFLHPLAYPAGLRFGWLARGGDFLALCGVLIAFALSMRWLKRCALTPLTIAGLLFTATGILLQRNDHWLNVFDFGRVYSPLLLFLALDGIETGWRTALLPIVLMDLRVFTQFGNQLLGILSALRPG